MNDFTKDMANALFNQDKINDLFRQKLQQAVNDLLESELTAFLGYNPYEHDGWNTGNSRNGAYYRKVDTQFGQIEIKVPRDRNGEFHQHTMPDYKRHTDVLEQTVIKLYSKGVTTREIADLIEKMYGGYYSPAMVSNISKEMIPKVEAYHQRHLSDKFFCVYLDATYIPLKRVTYEREAVYIAIGIKPNGHKEVIDYCIAPTENIEIGSEMLKGFKSRGLEQVELFLSDGVVGMKEAIILKRIFNAAWYTSCVISVPKCGLTIDKKHWMNSSRFILSQTKKWLYRCCMNSIKTGKNPTKTQLEILDRLSLIC